MDYTETRDLIYKPKRFVVVEIVLIIINAVLNLICRFLKFLWRGVIQIRQNKQVYIKYTILILTFVKNIFKNIKSWF